MNSSTCGRLNFVELPAHVFAGMLAQQARMWSEPAPAGKWLQELASAPIFGALATGATVQVIRGGLP